MTDSKNPYRTARGTFEIFGSHGAMVNRPRLSLFECDMTFANTSFGMESVDQNISCFGRHDDRRK